MVVHRLVHQFNHRFALPRGRWRLMQLALRLDPPPEQLLDVAFEPRIRLDLQTSDDVDRRIYFNTIDVDVTRAIRAYVSPGQHVVDVGANIGYFTLQLARRVGPAGSVRSFEPNPAVFERLQRHIAKNGCQQIVRAEQLAVSDAAGTLDLHIHPGYHGLSSLEPDPAWPEPTVPVRVAVATLDQLLAGAAGRPVSFIKIDVEGAELQVLRGGAATIARDRPVIVAEVWLPQHRRFGYTTEAIWRWAAEQGYRALFLDNLGRPVEVPPERADALPEGNVLLLPRERRVA